MRGNLEKLLRARDQEHLLRDWDALDSTARKQLARQIPSIDFDEIARLLAARKSAKTGNEESVAEMSRRASPASRIVRLPETDVARARWAEATARGHAILAAGRVGVILVAGGQGTRLGFPHPKGMFPIGPVSGNPMFQLLAEQVIARARQAGATIPCYIMTSAATHDETVAFFEEHDFFGLDAESVYFFQQGWMPAVHAETGKLLMSEKGSLATSPDGHGGMLSALMEAGLFDDMRLRGVDLLFYHQVDNPLCRVCDPAFLGFHVAYESEATTKVVAKTGPQEKMGVVVEVDGQTRIIEYSDLPDDVAAQVGNDGELLFWAGSTAIHIFNREFLERLTQGGIALPFHIAHKKVSYLNERNELVAPIEPNAYKFERFIFDALPHASKSLVVEAAREKEFHPLKNAKGVNSPEDVKKNLVAVHRQWLRSAGHLVPDDAVVEVSPLLGVDEQAIAEASLGEMDFRTPLYLQPPEDPPARGIHK